MSVSDGIEDMLGFKSDDFLTGKVSLRSRIHADDQDIADDLFSTDIHKSSGTFNIRLRQSNGHIRCVKGHFIKTLDTSGNNLVLDLLLQDAKSLRQRLSDQPIMANIKSMMENTDDYIYFKDRNHVFTAASQTLVEITESNKHWTELIGLTDYDVFAEEYADIYYLLEKQVFAGIAVAHDVQETLDQDGNKGWVDNRKYPMHDENGEIIGLFGIARIITEHRLMENALIKNETRLLLSQIGGGIGAWETDLVNNRQDWSENCASLLGFPAMDELAWEGLAFMHPDDRQHMVEATRSHIEDGTKYDVEYRTVAENGIIHWMHSAGQAEYNADGKPIWMRRIVQDITEHKQVEKVLLDDRKHVERQLKKSMVELSQLKAESGEVNTALKVMIKLRETESSDAKDLLALELKQEVMPFLQRLKNGIRDPKQIRLLNTLDANLQRLISSYGCTTSITSSYKTLTPKEIQVASMVREGLSTKVIASTLSLSTETISIHRKNIRKKLGLDSKADNLRSNLMILDV
ncbi:MAG: PAS domain-containing protein [Methylotenera sp.]